MLSTEEKKRYNRHIILDKVGMEGQEKLRNASVLVIGAGGLGCPILLYLTAAGVGRIGIIDDDVVDVSNLQRQVLFDTNDVGQSKAATAAQKLQLQNPHITFQTWQERLTSQNALVLFEQFDLIIDGTDNFPTRYLINDACVLTGKPFVFGSIFKFEGQVSVFNHKEGPTYRCIFPSPPGAGEVPNCAQIGVIGVLPGLIGTIQASEAIKIITGIGEPLSGKLLLLDTLSMHQTILNIHKTEAANQITELIDYEDFCGVGTPPSLEEVSVEELHSALQNDDPPFLLDVREAFEFDICHLDAKLIPLGEIANRVAEIPRDREIVVYCHHGIRSASAATTLIEEYGFSNVKSLAGGIHEWAESIEPDMERY